jgi:hypothetical protein
VNDRAAKSKGHGDSPHISSDFLDLEYVVEEKHNGNLHSRHENYADVNDADSAHLQQWEDTVLRRHIDQVENLSEDENVEHKSG